MKILITFALDAELAPWRRLARLAPVSQANFHAYESASAGRSIRAVLTGVGPLNAQRIAHEALQWAPDVCICAGLAGSLRAEHHKGDVLTAATVRDLETHRPLEADGHLLQLAVTRGAQRIGVLGTSKDMVSTVADKHRLARIADAVDMESFSVLAEAAKCDIPAISIRAISDTVDENLPMDFGQVLDNRGQVIVTKVARHVARHPGSLPGLMRLSSASRAASLNLARFLESYVAALSATRAARVPTGSEMALA